MSTIAELLQAGQQDLELAAVKPKVLLQPFYGTQPLFTIEDAASGGLDATKVGYGTSPMVTVGNFEKKAGVKLSNKPTANRIMSAGAGSPTRILFSESGKGITYNPQEINFLNAQNSWGFTPDALSTPSSKGGITIAIPSLPTRIVWRCVMIAADTFNGLPIYLYWIANRAEVGDRQDINAVDSNVYEQGVSLEFQDDAAVGEDSQVIFGICGDGWREINKYNNTGLYPAVTGLTNTVAPVGTTMTVSAGSNHTKQLTVLDNNGIDRTSQATYVSSDPSKATVTTPGGGLVTAVAAGTPTITASYGGFTTTYSPTVS